MERDKEQRPFVTLHLCAVTLIEVSSPVPCKGLCGHAEDVCLVQSATCLSKARQQPSDQTVNKQPGQRAALMPAEK